MNVTLTTPTDYLARFLHCIANDKNAKLQFFSSSRGSKYLEENSTFKYS